MFLDILWLAIASLRLHVFSCLGKEAETEITMLSRNARYVRAINIYRLIQFSGINDLNWTLALV
jgi:hypothetical protein